MGSCETRDKKLRSIYPLIPCFPLWRGNSAIKNMSWWKWAYRMMGQPRVLRHWRSFISSFLGSRCLGTFFFCFASVSSFNTGVCSRSWGWWYRATRHRRCRRHAIARYLICKQSGTWYWLIRHRWILTVTLRWHRRWLEIARGRLRLSRDGRAGHSHRLRLRFGSHLWSNRVSTITREK
jgi:hypothetical protein